MLLIMITLKVISNSSLSFQIFSGNVADLDSKVSDVFNSIINKLRSAAKEFAYFNNLVQVRSQK